MQTTWRLQRRPLTVKVTWSSMFKGPGAGAFKELKASTVKDWKLHGAGRLLRLEEPVAEASRTGSGVWSLSRGQSRSPVVKNENGVS